MTSLPQIRKPTPLRSRQKASAETVDAVLGAYHAGESIRSIGVRLGRSENSVWNIIYGNTTRAERDRRQAKVEGKRADSS